MNTLTDDFFSLLADGRDEEAVALLGKAPSSPERDGLLGYCLYNGIGGFPQDDERAFLLFEQGALVSDSLSLYELGLMCENGDTPDQREGGPRQKYDHYDAEGFMQRCADGDGTFAATAWLWLGEYFLDSARGGDPECGVEYLEKAADAGMPDAVELLAVHYREIADYFGYGDPDANRRLLRWQQIAYENNPHDESYNYGMLLDGVEGIPANVRLALKLYEEDWEHGHSQGARALALHYGRRAADPALAADERAEAAVLSRAWHERAGRNAGNDYSTEQSAEEK